MDADRWREIESLFHAARDSPANRRAELLANVDAAVRHEVEALLAQCDQEGPLDFATELLKEIGSPATLEQAAVRLEPGMALGSYVVLSTLGRGGMGEVYRARDTKLDRDVAIKVLPASMAPDAERIGRFQREAKTLAALNHPNIAAIYGLEERDGITALVLELVEGPTLGDRIAQGPVPLDEAVRIATQIAEALEAAHDRGIVHRDLKPSNIKLRPDGTVKVLDFGLATRPGRLDAPDANDNGPAPRAGMTRDGIILGTVGYMSPEQAAGKPAGLASDQFSFGVILFELLTGRRVFARATTIETLFAITHDHVSLVHLDATVPAELRRIVERCLAKRASDRFADTRQLAREMRRIRDHSAGPQSLEAGGIDPVVVAPAIPPDVTAARRMMRRPAVWLAAAALATMASLAIWRPWPAGTGVGSLAVLPFVNVAHDPDVEYLCDGITESLIQQISRLPSLTVMARSTVFNFKDKPIDAREAGRRLGVNAVLTGTVSRQSGRVRITAELVDVASGARLWGDAFDRDISGVVSIQDEIAKAIVGEGIRLKLSGDERRALVSHLTDDAAAYELYLRARYAVFRTTEEDTLQARDLLKRAIVRDPRFTAAYSALAATYLAAAIDGFERPVEAIPEARQLLRKVSDIDPQFPDAHGPAATIAFFFDWDWTAAEREWGALDRLPSGALPIQERVGYSLARWALAGPADALQVVRRIRRDDPLTVSYVVLEADYLFHAGQLDSAATLYEQALQDGATPDALFGLAEVRVAQGRFDDAIDVRRRAHRATGDAALADMVITARGEDGYRQIEKAAARHDLQALRARVGTAYVSPLDLARAHAVLGDREQALSYFDEAFADRAPGLVFLKVDRAWDSVRDDPRFADAVRRVRLP